MSLASKAVAAALVLVSCAALASAQPRPAGTVRTDLQRHDLSAAGREVVQAIVSLAPGAVAPRHSHPGEEIIYVLKGTWVYQLEGQPSKTLKAGDVLFVPYGVVHSARNIGTEPGSELATYVVEKGKPLLELAE